MKKLYQYIMGTSGGSKSLPQERVKIGICAMDKKVDRCRLCTSRC